jgi:hypothetical protein
MVIEKIRAASLDELIEKAVEAHQSDTNRKRIGRPDKIRLIVGIGRPVFARVFGFDTARYFAEPEICLRAQLQWKLWQFYILKDDTPFDLSVGCDYATAFEPSFYGADPIFPQGSEPTYGRPVIRRPADLSAIDPPDFFRSGLMPSAHAMYEGLKELSKGRLDVFFPGYARGPWSIATILRGFNDIFLDYTDRPSFLHQLLHFCTQTRIEWDRQRCRFLGISPKDRTLRWKYVVYRNNTASDLFEDEVDGNLFSPELYRECILPYHRHLSEYYGGIHYFHSCGNLTSFMKDIQSLPITGMQHISVGTDFKKALETISPEISLQYSLDAWNDVMAATEEQMRGRISDLIECAGERRMDICADALYSGGEELLSKTERLCKIFREVSLRS